jgi:hypothetical protein
MFRWQFGCWFLCGTAVLTVNGNSFAIIEHSVSVIDWLVAVIWEMDST